MSNIVTVAIPEPLIIRAKRLQMNISEVCRDALSDAVEKEEKNVAGSPSKANTRNSTPVREAQ